MKNFKKDLDQKITLLERRDQEVLNVLKRFQSSLTCLSYEGKPLLGRNLQRTREEAVHLMQKTSEVFKVESRAVFPFMEKHVPKLEPVIHALGADHRELQKQYDYFVKRTRGLSVSKNSSGKGELFREVKEAGTYMICFVRHHLETKRTLIYKSMKRYLKEEEVGIFGRQIKRACGK